MIGLIPAIVFWVITLYLFRPSALGRVAWPESYVTRLFTFCLAVGITVKTDPIAALLDRVLMNNASWYLGYVFTAVGAYFGLYTWAAVHHLSMRRSTFILIGTLVVWTILFPFLGIDREFAHDGTFASVAHLVFSITMYLYLALMALEVLPMMRRLLKDERSPTGQIRIMSGIGGVQCGFGFGLLRSLVAGWVFFNPEWGLTNLANQVTTLLIALCALGMGTAAAPQRFLFPLAQVRAYFQQQRMLYRLRRLRNELNGLTSPLPWPAPTWKERLLQPSYALYCTVIDILDRRSLFVQTRADSPALTPSHLSWLFVPLPETDWTGILDYFRRNMQI